MLECTGNPTSNSMINETPQVAVVLHVFHVMVIPPLTRGY